MSAPLNENIALRIGLASKELVGVSARDLLSLLIQIMGEPITHAKLEKLRARKLIQAGGDKFNRVDRAKFEKSFSLLKGRGVDKYLNPKPEYATGSFCDMHESLLVAIASNRGENIDGTFSGCVRYLIYQVSTRSIRLIDIREPVATKDKLERNQLRANLIGDCALVYSTSIGAIASAKIVKVGGHAITVEASADGIAVNASDELSRLQRVLMQQTPPPWLVKAMAKPLMNAKCLERMPND